MATVKQRQQQTIATLIMVLVITEIVIHFCWKILDEYFFEGFTVTMSLAVLAVITLLAILAWREYVLVSGLGGGKMSRFRLGGRRVREAYGGVYRKGRFDVGEYLGFIIYIVFALTAFGLMASEVTAEYTWLSDFCALGVAGSALFVFFKGKEKKQNRHWTALEVITLGVAIVIPVAMVWQPLSDIIQISTYIDTIDKKVLAFLGCLSCLWISAKQD